MQEEYTLEFRHQSLSLMTGPELLTLRWQVIHTARGQFREDYGDHYTVVFPNRSGLVNFLLRQEFIGHFTRLGKKKLCAKFLTS